MSDKWMKAAGLLVTTVSASRPNSSSATASSGLKFSSTETGIEFKKIAKSSKSINKKDYDLFLESLVKRKNSTQVEDEKNKIKRSLAMAPKPTPNSSSACSTSASTTAKSNDVVSRLTDHTKYTGSHKHRFDAETGKGKGKEGRV